MNIEDIRLKKKQLYQIAAKYWDQNRFPYLAQLPAGISTEISDIDFLIESGRKCFRYLGWVDSNLRPRNY